MKIHNFISIILLLLFAVALVQCSKESASTEEFGKNLELRDQIPGICEADLGPGQESFAEYVDSIFHPMFPTCPMVGWVVYKKNVSEFAFTDFVLTIPDDNDCEELNDFIKNSGVFGKIIILNYLSNYVYAEAKLRILTDYANENPGVPFISNVLTFKGICTELCEYLDPLCLPLEFEEFSGDDPKRPGVSDIQLRIPNRCWKYRWINCGDGCCVTTENYVRYGIGLRLDNSSTSSFGDCIGGPPIRWPGFKDGCWSGRIISDCEARCSPN